MRIGSRFTDLRSRRSRAVDLKTSLILRIAAVAVGCFVLVTAAMLLESRWEARQHATAMAELVAKHLNLQLLRINTGIDASKRFPDWDALLTHTQTDGECVRLQDIRGRVVRSNCVGTLAHQDEAPVWFSAAWSVLTPENQAESAVSYKGQDYGTVVVSSDPKAIAGHAWSDMQHLLTLTALTILSLSLLVYVAIARALAPTKNVIAGLNRISAGVFSHRLPRFKLSELQRIAEVANELAEKVETTLSQRADLLKRLMNAQEEERRHLARELHDELGQNLTAIAALAASLEKSAEQASPDLSDEARILSQISLSTMQAMRQTLAHLRPADIDKFGLSESLKHLVDVCSASHGHTTRFELNVPREIAPLSDTAAIHIFRIAQEGLTNAAKHADAKTVRLSLESVSFAQPKDPHAAGIRLTIEDDGKGRRFNGKMSAGGMGILNMQERVAALGGSISFDDRPGGGLTVHVIVPVNMKQKQPGERPRD